MRPATVYANLDTAEHQQLIDRLHGPWREPMRALMVLLSAYGWDPADIAGLLCLHPGTVRRWINRYGGEGLPGLPDRARSGRPRLGPARLGQRIAALLSDPGAWTTGRIWRALQRPALSLRTMYRRIREHAQWRRPRHVAKSCPDHDRIVAGIRTHIADLPPGSVVVAEDETHLSWLAVIRACWTLPGLRHLIPTPGSNVRRSIFGAVNMLTGQWHYHIAVKAVSEVFCYFLQLLEDAYPDAPVIAVICDNGTIHHSGYTRTWLTGHPRVRVIEGATYSPQDNPTERMWAALKRAIDNTATDTINHRIRQAHRFFRDRTPQQNLTTCAPWSSPWLPDSYAQKIWQPA